MGRWEPWVLAAGAVVLLAAVIWTVRPEGTPDGVRARPHRGDIWWAELPLAAGAGSKLRLCLILLRHRRGVVVLTITSQDMSGHRDHLPIPARAWDPSARRDSYVCVGEPIMVSAEALRRRAGVCDPAVLQETCRRAGLQPRDLRNFAKHAS